MRKRASGFTLIELLVVIAIIGILSSIVVVSVNSARGRAQVAARLESAKQVQNAIEIYYATTGNYPNTGNSWSSACSAWGSRGANTDDWIPGLSPTYIPILPSDPNTDGASHCCYVYRSNKTDYKLLVAYNCPQFNSATYGAYPTLVDPARDNGGDTCKVDGAAISSWALYSQNACSW